MPVSLMPPRPARDPRFAELDALIKAGRGDDRPVQSRGGTAYRKQRAPYGSLKRANLEATAAQMRERYASDKRGQAHKEYEEICRHMEMVRSHRWPKRESVSL